MTARSWSRRLALTLAAVAGALLAAASVAWACTSLATLDLDRNRAGTGTAVNGTGEGFSGNPLASEVEVHFDSADGPLLWSGRPDLNGDLAFDFETPAVAPGHYVVIATQTDASGNPAAGTPARAQLEVVEPAAGGDGASQAPARSTDGAPAEQGTAEQAPPQQPAEQQPATAGREDVAAGSAAQGPAIIADGAPPGGSDAPAAGPVERSASVPQADAAAPAQTARNQRTTTLEAPSEGRAILALLLVGVGGLLALGTAASVVATRRRGSGTPAEAPVTRHSHDPAATPEQAPTDD